jgi:hypothetical protein
MLLRSVVMSFHLFSVRCIVISVIEFLINHYITLPSICKDKVVPVPKHHTVKLYT